MTFWDMIHHQSLSTQECQRTPTVFALSLWTFCTLLSWWSWRTVSVMISDNLIFWIKFCIVQKAQVLHSRWEIGIITNMVDLKNIMHVWRVINARPYGISTLIYLSIVAICCQCFTPQYSIYSTWMYCMGLFGRENWLRLWMEDWFWDKKQFQSNLMITSGKKMKFSSFASLMTKISFFFLR